LAKKNNSTTANLGFEEKLWAAADKLRGHMDPREYKHTVLGLIFLKYISDRFSAHREKLQTEMADPESILYIKEEKAHYLTLEDRDEYTGENVFWVPMEARWETPQDQSKDPSSSK
jgi:type I restriction enzyme M protein